MLTEENKHLRTSNYLPGWLESYMDVSIAVLVMRLLLLSASEVSRIGELFPAEDAKLEGILCVHMCSCKYTIMYGSFSAFITILSMYQCQ